jgi:phosphoglycolate phosphatase-like HAD superfamily hydrolase
MIQASGESEHHKPDPRVFDVLIRLLQGSNINKNEILYVGDSLSDLYAASDAELQFIAVLTGSTSRQQFHAAGVSKDRILYSVAELSEELRIGSA